MTGDTSSDASWEVAKLLWREVQFTSPAIAILTDISLSALTERLGDRQLGPSPSGSGMIWAKDVAPLSALELETILSADPELVAQRQGYSFLIPDWRERARLFWDDPTLSARQVSDALGVTIDKLNRDLGSRPSVSEGKAITKTKHLSNKNSAQLTLAREMWADPLISVRSIADKTGIDATTLYKVLGVKPGRLRQDAVRRMRVGPSPEQLKQAREMWKDPSLSERQIARMLDIPVHVLKRHLGKRPSQIRWRGKSSPAPIPLVKLELAREMWADTDSSIGSISKSTGISGYRLRHFFTQAGDMMGNPNLTTHEIALAVGIEIVTPKIRERERENETPELLEQSREMWFDLTITAAQVERRTGIMLHRLRKLFGPRGMLRKRTSMTPEQLEQVRLMWADPSLTIRDVSSAVGLSRARLHQIFGARKLKRGTRRA